MRIVLSNNKLLELNLTMKSYDIEKTKSSSVVCEGKEGTYDHPKVYLKMAHNQNEIQCPYCSKKFIL